MASFWAPNSKLIIGNYTEAAPNNNNGIIINYSTVHVRRTASIPGYKHYNLLTNELSPGSNPNCPKRNHGAALITYEICSSTPAAGSETERAVDGAGPGRVISGAPALSTRIRWYRIIGTWTQAGILIEWEFKMIFDHTKTSSLYMNQHSSIEWIESTFEVWSI